MHTDFYYESQGGGRIHGCRWTPEGEPKAIVQILHGIAEYAERYDDLAAFLTKQGYLVVAEDHMGHGQSICEESPQGYFNGGWFAAVDDSYQLLSDTRREFPEVPYILFGHSMGSFLARTILARYPESGISGAILCGTGWQPEMVVKAGKVMSELVCRRIGEQNPSARLHSMIFGGYNKKVEHKRTKSDWLSRDKQVVDAYEADPLCGFIPSAGLLRDMMTGILYIQNPSHMASMRKDLPVLFIAGGDDPVGNYGKGVRQAAQAFRGCGMERVDLQIYPLCRHEIHNEINRQEVYNDVAKWIKSVLLD